MHTYELCVQTTQATVTFTFHNRTDAESTFRNLRYSESVQAMALNSTDSTFGSLTWTR